MLVNGGVVNSSKAHSSSSHVITTKGSSVWLHWNYTYIGDGIHEKSVYLKSTYKEQIIGINSISRPRFQALAKRIGQNGALTLESPVPAPFSGRVDVISSNSTLVIHDLQYNDSTYRVSSDVNVHIDIDAGPILYEFRLKPVVSLTVFGNFLAVHFRYHPLIRPKEFWELPPIYLLKFLPERGCLSDIFILIFTSGIRDGLAKIFFESTSVVINF